MFELTNKPIKHEVKSLKGTILKYMRYWWWFLVGLLVCLGLAFLYLRFKAVPEYLISSTILSKDSDREIKASEVKSAEDLSSIMAASLNPEANIPFNPGTLQTSAAVSTYEGYLVDNNVNIDLILILELNLEALLNAQLMTELIEILSEYLKNAVLNIRFLNHKITLPEEVNHPPTYTIDQKEAAFLRPLEWQVI